MISLCLQSFTWTLEFLLDLIFLLSELQTVIFIILVIQRGYKFGREMFFCINKIVCLILFTINCFVLIYWTVFQLLCHLFAFLLRVICFYIVRFHFWQIELLRTKNRSWTCNSYPTYECFSWNLVMLHCPQSNKRTSSS